MPNLMYVAIAALAGAAMALQGTLNSALGKIVGIWESTLIVHVIGAVVTLIFILALGVGFNGLNKMGSAPWYVYLGGFLNVVIIFAVVKTMPAIGVGNATTAIIVAQLITAFVIDCTGAFGMKKIAFHYWDIFAIGLLAVGARILFLE